MKSLSYIQKDGILRFHIKTMKTTQEIERHISLNEDVARNDIYAKVLFHNIVGVLRKEINHELEKRQTEKNMS